MDTSAIEAELAEQTKLLRAILSVIIDQSLEHDGSPRSRFGGLEHLLSETTSMTQAEIGVALGKTSQAVGQAITRQKARSVA
jgi:hypothetical protein